MKFEVKDGKVSTTFDIRFEVDGKPILAAICRAHRAFGDGVTKQDVERVLQRLVAEHGEQAAGILIKEFSHMQIEEARKTARRLWVELRRDPAFKLEDEEQAAEMAKP